MKAEKKKAVIKLGLRVIVTVVLVWLVLGQVNVQGVAYAVGRTNWSVMAIAWGIGISAYWVRSVRLRFILMKQECHVGTAKLYGATAITTLYSLVLPGMLSVGVKWYILRTITGKAARVLSSMLYNQISETLTKLILGLVAVVFYNPFGHWYVSAASGVLAVIVLLTSFLLLDARAYYLLYGVLKRLLIPFPTLVKNGVTKTFESMRLFQSCDWRFHGVVAAINLFSAFQTVVIYWLTTQALGIAVPFLALLWQGTAVYMLGKIPISVANIGVREWTLVGLLSLYGVDATKALAFSLLIFSHVLIMACVGAAYQLCWTSGFKTIKTG